jgi:hypothetical protein
MEYATANERIHRSFQKSFSYSLPLRHPPPMSRTNRPESAARPPRPPRPERAARPAAEPAEPAPEPVGPLPAPPPEEPDEPIPFTPVPFARNRRSGWTEARQRAFIAALAEFGSVSAAAKSVGMSARGAYRLRERPGAESFAAAWDIAQESGRDRVRDMLVDRAMFGEIVPRFRKGRLVSWVHRYDFRAALAVLGTRDIDLMERRNDARDRRAWAKRLDAEDAARAEARRESAEAAEANRLAWEQAEREAADPKRRRGPPPQPRVRFL